jgi:5'-nucleotidase
VRRSRAAGPGLVLLLALLTLVACARTPVGPDPKPGAPFALTIAHLNDTHSHLEPAETRLTLGGEAVTARLGGVARLKSAIDAARAEARADGSRFLLLHAGDAVQGTLFFNVFQGAADMDMLNRLGLDAMTLGNHEFDRGPELTAEMVRRAEFPVVSANVDAARVPALAAGLRPWIVKDLGGVRVGVVGVTTPGTANISSPGPVRFSKAAPAVAKAVRELAEQGVRTVIVLSHLGYAEDVALAKSVPGIGVIVGGHSHSLLGQADAFAPLGLKPEGPYPTELRGPDGGRVLVVQAWRWGMELGLLRVDFDANGRVAGFTARPRLIAGGGFRKGGEDVPAGTMEHNRLTALLTSGDAARSFDPDPEVAANLAPLAARLDGFRTASIGARAEADLVRGTATDPGPVIADAYLAAAPAAQAALLLPGNVRQDIFQGDITQDVVMGVLPFGNTLVTIELTGAQLTAALEEAAEHRLRVRPGGETPHRTVLFHVAGMTCRVDAGAGRGARVHDLRVRGADGRLAPLDPAATYRLVTNSFLAGGGDGMATFKNARGLREDTGILASDALAAHLARLGVVRPPAEHRVLIETPKALPPRPVSLLRPAIPASAALSRAA